MNWKHGLMFAGAVALSLVVIFFVTRRAPANIRALFQA